MIIVLKPEATLADKEGVCARVKGKGYEPEVGPFGSDTAVYVKDKANPLNADDFRLMSGVGKVHNFVANLPVHEAVPAK